MTPKAGLTDAGLAGVIIGWFLAVPILIVLMVTLFSLYSDGKLGFLTNCNCCDRSGESDKGKKVATEPLKAPVEMVIDRPGPTTSGEPPQSHELVKQVREVCPNATTEQIRKALRENGWDVARAIPALVTDD